MFRRRVSHAARERYALAMIVAFAAVLLAPRSSAAREASPAEGLSDASSAVTEAGAAALAEQFGHAVVAESDTSETEEVTAQPDGSFELTESSEPVQFIPRGATSPTLKIRLGN